MRNLCANNAGYILPTRQTTLGTKYYTNWLTPIKPNKDEFSAQRSIDGNFTPANFSAAGKFCRFLRMRNEMEKGASLGLPLDFPP
jgi:hypothetical protein